MKISLMKIFNINFSPRGKTEYFLSILLSIIFSSLLLVNTYAEEETVNLQEKEVAAIDIVGNKTISVATLLPKIKTKVATKYSINVARDDIKRLYALGYFDDVRIELKEAQNNKVKVIFQVSEKPIVDDISFIGNRKVSKRELENSMKTKKALYLDKQQLRSDLEEIKRVYARKGYSSAEANFDSILDQEKNRVKLTIKINEGLPSRVKIVAMEGNSAFSDAKLIGLIKSKRAFWLFFRKGYLDESVVDEDVERLLAFYRSQGFIDVKVDKEIEALKRGWNKLIFNINEGKRYYVGDVIIDGNVAFAADEIKQRLKVMSSGHVFSQDGLETDKFNVRSFYMDKGYIFAKIDGSTSLNQETGKIDVNFNIVEDEVVYVNLIKVKGNVKTKDVVIRRELRIKPGDRFDGDKLRRSKERLANLGFFDETEGIDFDIEPTQEKNKSNLVVQVKETHTGNLSFGGGYSTVDQLVGFIELEQKNFDWKNFPYFTGAGQDLKLRASIGTITENFLLSFTEPWLFDYPISFGFDAFKTKHDRNTDVGYGYSEKRTGGMLRLGKEISDFWRTDSYYQMQEISISDVDSGASADFRKEEGKNTLSTFGIGATFDNRDNVFDPHRGFYIYNSADCNGGPFGGDKNFSKFWNSTSYFISMPKDSVTLIKIRMGIESPFGDSEEVPIYERFFAGGADTIRGYNERKVGPVDSLTSDPIGGQAMIVGNIEYMYPIGKYLKLATFIDSGNVWARTKDFAKGGFKSGTGVGVRVKTPFGPVKLDYGYPLNLEAGKESRTGRIHFSFSRGF